MKIIFTKTASKISTIFCLLLFQLGAAGLLQNAQAQSVVRPTSVISSDNTDNPGRAINGNSNNFARLRAYGGVFGGGGSYDGELLVAYDHLVPAYTTTFIRLDDEDGFVANLLGGTVGEIVGTLIGGNLSMTIEAFNGGSQVAEGTIPGSFNTDEARILTAADGNIYAAITPSSPYNRIQITTDVTAVILGSRLDVDVYDIFYSTATDNCGSAFGTSYDVTGVTLNPANINGNVGENLERAIDGNLNTFSVLNPGALSVAGTTRQHFYFSSEGLPTDELKITLSLSQEIANVALLSNIYINLYHNNTQVTRYSIDDLGDELLGILGLDLLGLFADGEPVTFSVQPGVSYDRAEIELSGVLSANLVANLRIHEVARSASRPTINDVDAQGNMVVCTGTDVVLTATPGVNTDIIRWYDAPVGGNELHEGAIFNAGEIAYETTYYASATSAGCTESSVRVAVTVGIDPDPTINLNGSSVYSVAMGQSLQLPNATADNATSSGWQSLDGLTIDGNRTVQFNQAGIYTFRYSATGTSCTNYVDVVVNVIDPDGCNFVFNRVYANNGTVTSVSSLLGVPLGTVTNPNRAADGNPQTYSLLTETVNLLNGVLTGRTSQTLSWNQNIPAGTPVTIKLGREYGAATVNGGITVQAFRNSTPVGPAIVVDQNLVSAINGVNEFEFTFVPVSGGSPAEYDAVRVSIVPGVINTLQSVRVYDAYYHQNASTLADCTPGALDILTGFESMVGGLDVASGLTAVTNAGNAVDNDMDTYAVLYNLVGAAVRSKLDITFNQPSLAGDSMLIKIGIPTGLLDLNVIGSFVIQRYLGDQEVGTPTTLNSGLLSLSLLTGNTTGYLTFTTDQPFDRIKILSGGVVSGLENLRIYEVKNVPKVTVPGLEFDDVNDIYFVSLCEGSTIQMPTNECDQFKLYDAATGGTEITLAEIQSWPAGTVRQVYVQAFRFGCESGDYRQEIEIRITEVAQPIISPDGNIFVQNGDQITLTISNAATYAAGTTFEWYRNGTLITGETSSTLVINSVNVANDLGAYTAVAVGECKSIASVPVNLMEFDVDGWKSYVVNTGNDYVSGGEEITYTIHVRNNSGANLNDLLITDNIPQRTTYVAGSASNGGTLSSGTLTWTGIDVAAGATATVSFTVRANNNLVGVQEISNVALIKRSPSDPGTPTYPPLDNDNPDEPDDSGDPGTDIPVVLISNIDVLKVADQASVIAGTPTTFTVTLTNRGPSFMPNGAEIRLRERPGTGVTITGYEILSGAATITSNGLEAVVRTNAVVAIDAEIVVRIHATIDPSASGTITNGVSVWRPGIPQTDPPVDSDTDPIPVVKSTDLAIDKTIDNYFPFVDENVAFTLTVTNQGPSNASGVVVTDQLPDGFEYVSHSATQGSYNETTHLWEIGDLDDNQSVTLVITAKVLASGNYTNTGSVDGDEDDPDLTNNEDTPDDPVVPINRSDSRMDIVKNNALANGVDENRLEVTILDTRGDGVENAVITFTITRPGNAVSTETISTDANGKALLALTSTTPGQVVVAAATPGVTIVGSPRTVTFIAGPVDHARSELVVIKNNAVANGVDENILEATIVDATGNPRSGQAVVFTITDVNNVTRTQTVTTDANGKSRIALTSTQSGDAVVAAAVGGTQISGSPKTVTFVAGDIDYNRSTFVVTKNNAVADGFDENRLLATIVDAFGNPIAGAAVDFDYVDLDGSTQSLTVNTSASGQAPLAITSTVIGNISVSAEVAGTAVNGSPRTVTFVAGAVDHDKSTLTIIKNNANADGVDQNRLLAKIVDAFGNPIRNKDVAFLITDVNLGNRAQTIRTDANGEAVLNLTSSIPGDVEVAAEVDGGAISGSPQTVTFVLATDLSVYKTADDARVIAGSTTTFTITIRNNSTVAIPQGEVIRLLERPGTGVEITNFVVVSGPATISFNGNEASLTTTGSLATSAEIVVRVHAEVSETARGTITNGISVWGPETPPEDDPDDEDDIPPVPIDVIADLAIEKTVDNNRPFVGSQITFTLEVTNNGPSDATGAWVLDQLPSGYRYVSSTATTGSYNANNHRWNIGDMTVGQVETLTITARVLASGDYINYGTISGDDEDPNLNNNTDSPDEPVIPQPVKGFKLTKVANVTSVEAGGEIEYTITVTNQGPNTIPSGSAIRVQELPSAGLTITSYELVSGPAVLTNTNNNVTLTTNQVLGVNESIVFKAVAVVDADAPDYVSNRVKVWSPEKDPETDEPDDDVPTPDIPVNNDAIMGITKVSDQATVISGGTASFTLTLTNNGPGVLKAGSSVLLEERPGQGLQIESYAVSSGDATISGSGNQASLTINSDIAKGGTITVKVTAKVVAEAGSTITNGISVWGPDSDPDDDPDDEDDTPPIPVGDAYTLSIVKTSDKARVVAGEETTFTVVIRNNGPESIPSGDQLTLRELPGTGLTILGYEVTAGMATIQGNANQATVTTTGAISNGGEIRVSIRAKVDERASGTITNGIEVWGDSKDPDDDEPDDRDDTDPTPVDSELLIPNLFTPNGDGLNDRFTIKGLMQYDQRELTIINRWGNRVYHSNQYNNDWDGGSLPEGTYFYILEVSKNGSVSLYRGPIAIVRNTTIR